MTEGVDRMTMEESAGCNARRLRRGFSFTVGIVTAWLT